MEYNRKTNPFSRESKKIVGFLDEIYYAVCDRCYK